MAQTPLKANQSITSPLHVAIIMDGTRRWAKSRNLSNLAGHKAGMETVRRVISACPDLDVGSLTLYAFSTENWRRPPVEVNGLMGLFKLYMQREIVELAQKGVRVQFIGDRSRFDTKLQQIMLDAEERTAGNTRLTVNVAMNYGSRNEIVYAVREIAGKVQRGELSPEKIDEDIFSKHLYTKDIPDPDLLIRTSGEVRLSNFLLWQMAYTEMIFTDKHWPDFTEDDFSNAIHTYKNRERRFGASIEDAVAQA